MDARPAVLAALRDRDRPGLVSARFHNGLADATAAAVARVAGERGLATAVLSGGVFQNRALLEGVAARLERAGLRVLTPSLLPPNDGGIAYGQAAVAARSRIPLSGDREARRADREPLRGALASRCPIPR